MGAGPTHWTYAIQQAFTEEAITDNEKVLIKHLYENHQWRPFFIKTDFTVNNNGSILLDHLEKLENEALDPAHYPREILEESLHELSVMRMNTPTVFSRKPVSQLVAMNSNQVHPPVSRIKPIPFNQQQDIYQVAARTDALLLLCLLRWTRDMNPFAQFDSLATQLESLGMETYLDSLPPQSWRYGELRQALLRYKELSETYALSPITVKKSLRRGDRGEAVQILQQHLAAEGFYDGDINAIFDEETEQAVRRFQEHHLLLPDGVVGRRTRAWINVSLQDKARLIADSLREMRRSYTRKYKRYLRINIPEFVLEYYNNGQLIRSHKIIVGRAHGKRIRAGKRWRGVNHTPALVSRIKRIIFNPRWYVPERIRLELDEKIAEDPDYLEKNGFVAMDSVYSTGEPRIYQIPGPLNPLGKVKFEFPNRYSIYLHDTSEKRLFKRIRRDFSHGCIRVENAVALAEQLLKDDRNPAASRTENYLKTNHQIFVRLKKPVPIIIEYIPVSVNSNRELIFCGDPYGRILSDGRKGFPL